MGSPYAELLPHHLSLLHDGTAVSADPRNASRRTLIVIPTKGRPHRIADLLARIPPAHDTLVLATGNDDIPWNAVNGGSRPRGNLTIQVGGLPMDSSPNLGTPNSDLAAKRTFGMRMARDGGYGGVIFLDDDLEVVPGHLARLANSLNDFSVAGLISSVGYPDHSTLYRVFNEAGLVSPFISGSALAVRTDYEGWFPDIYNEDWFFMWSAVRNREAAYVGTIRQYDLGKSRERGGHRAALEERGDLLAEGFYHHLHIRPDGGADTVLTTEAYWDAELERRGRLHDLAWSINEKSHWSDKEHTAESLMSGRAVLDGLTARQLAAAARELMQPAAPRQHFPAVVAGLQALRGLAPRGALHPDAARRALDQTTPQHEAQPHEGKSLDRTKDKGHGLER